MQRTFSWTPEQAFFFRLIRHVLSFWARMHNLLSFNMNLSLFLWYPALVNYLILSISAIYIALAHLNFITKH